MIHFSFKMGGSSWYIDPIKSSEGQPGQEYYVAEYLRSKHDDNHFVGHKNMILYEDATEKEVKSRIRSHYLDGQSENIRQKRVFYKPAFIQ